jgi:hypothetical protein
MKDTLNKIVHSGDKPGSNQHSIDNPFNDITNTYNREIDDKINWPYLYATASYNKGALFSPFIFPVRTLGT